MRTVDMLPAMRIAALAALAACVGDARQVTLSEKHLVVTGSPAGIDRFVALQASRRPALSTSVLQPAESGKRKAIVDLPPDFTGQDLVHATREALAAGLSYRYEERRWTPASAS